MTKDASEAKKSALDKRRRNLSNAKRVLLEERLKGAKTLATKDNEQKGGSTDGLPQFTQDQASSQIALRKDSSPAPLSFAQQRLWFLDQLNPGGTAYIIPLALRLQGSLSLDAIEAAFTILIERHESLRTNIKVIHDQPVQVIAPPYAVKIPTIKLDHLNNTEQDAAIQEELHRIVSTPFDLTIDPLLRLVNLYLGPQDRVLIIAMHHIISDGWSIGVLFRELGILSQTLNHQLPNPLPPLPIQYADYATWEREWLSGPEQAAQLNYWIHQLSGCTPLDIPTDYQRPPVQSMQGAAYPIVVPHELVTALTTLGQTLGATLFMGLVTVFQIVLSQWSGQKDIAVATPVAHRSRPELSNMIGFLVNTLVLRTDVDPTLTFRELLVVVKMIILEAFANQEVPFEQVVQALPLDRDQSRPPLAQVMIALQHAMGGPVEVPELTLTPLSIPVTTAKFELNLSFMARDGELHGGIEYATALFTEITIAQLAEQFVQVLRLALAHPDTPLYQLNWMTPSQQTQILEQSRTPWSSSKEPMNKTLPVWLAEQAQLTPHSIALTDQHTTLTYTELYTRVYDLAMYLQGLGVSPEKPVAICMNRSSQLVVGILAVLFAGGAYVPLDPKYPSARLEWMLEDSGAVLVLAEEDTQDVLPPTTVQTVLVDTADLSNSTQFQTPTLYKENLAYIIYTSGSTGKPKGVALTHANVVAFLSWSHQIFTPEHLSDVVASTSVCFDLSVFELFAPLTCGGTIILVSSVLDLETLPDSVQPSLLNTVPSALHSLLALDALPKSLQIVNVAGEPLSRALIKEMREKSNAILYNLYGPTEDTTYSTFWNANDASTGEPPIGRAIQGSAAYVMTQYGYLAPKGHIGEIVLGGNGIARGYWKQPRLTAERFRPDPWSEVPGARCYATGDYGRYASDELLRYHGRNDMQVKIRGFRIELGEVQTALAQISEIYEAAAVVKPDHQGVMSLVGYVVPHPHESIDEVRIQAQLGKTLPSYMVPSKVVVLKALPRTPNGKLDRAALPDPFDIETAVVTELQSQLQVIVSGLWSKILGKPVNDPNANFFSLGGHSLLATQVVAQTRAQWNISLPLRSIFDAPTIATYSSLIAQLLIDSEEDTSIPLEPIDRDQPLLLSYAQQRLWFLDQLVPQSTAYLVPMAVRLQGALPLSAVEHAFSLLVARHETLRTTITTVEGQPLQVIAEPYQVSIPVVDISHLDQQAQTDAIEQHVQADANTPFDLAKGPLLRIKALYLGVNDHVLLVTMHHIITDGWSMGILLRELGILAQLRDQNVNEYLPALPIQYVDYAIWQRRWLTGAIQAQQLAYWVTQLSHCPPLELPLDFSRPPVQSPDGGEHLFQISLDTTEKLKELGHQTETTLFMVLLTSFHLLLAQWSGQTDLAVATPIANRTRPEVANIIGFFVNTLVLRTKLQPTNSFRNLLSSVRTTTLEAFAHQDIPFEQVVQALPLERDQSRPPLAQVSFALQHVTGNPVTIDDITLTPMRSHVTAAKFELSLECVDRDDGLMVTLGYAKKLFSEKTIKRLADQFLELVDTALKQPDAILMDLFKFAPAPSQVVRSSSVAAVSRSGSSQHPSRISQAKQQLSHLTRARLSGPQAPRDQLERQLVQLWQELLNVRPIGIQDDFFMLGGHSLLAMRLIASIQKSLGVQLSIATLFQHGTVVKIAEIIRQAPLDTTASMLALQPHGTGTPLFLVHPIGGRVNCYTDLAEHASRPVYAFQAIGMDGSQPPLKNIPSLAARYIHELQAIQPQGPYLLGGWSFGGVVAFEMAQQLRQQGETVDNVILIDSFAPLADVKPEAVEAEDESAVVIQFANDMFGLAAHTFQGDSQAFKIKTTKEQLATVLEQAQNIGFLDSHVDLAELHAMFDVFKANVVAMWNYQLNPYPGKLTLFKAQDALVQEGMNNWEYIPECDLTCIVVPGGHYTLLQPPFMTTIVQRINEHLDPAI